MTLVIELTPENEHALREEASRLGIRVEEYARVVLEKSVPTRPGGAFQDGATSDEEFEAALDAFSEGSEHLPVLPPEADRREWIYGDHD